MQWYTAKDEDTRGKQIFSIGCVGAFLFFILLTYYLAVELRESANHLSEESHESVEALKELNEFEKGLRE